MPLRVRCDDAEYAALGRQAAPDEPVSTEEAKELIYVRLFDHPAFRVLTSEAGMGCCATVVVLTCFTLASGPVERLVCGSPNRHFIANALCAAAYGVFMPLMLLGVLYGLRQAIRADHAPGKDVDQQPDQPVGTLQHMACLALVQDFKRLLARDDWEKMLDEVEAYRRNVVKILMLRCFLLIAMMSLVAYGLAELLWREEENYSAIGGAMRTWLVAVGPGHCVSAFTPRLYTMMTFVASSMLSVILPQTYLFLGSLAAGADIVRRVLQLVKLQIVNLQLNSTTHQFTDDKWKTSIWNPAVHVMVAMEKLSRLGASISVLIVGCIGTALGLLPTAISSGSVVLYSFVFFWSVMPFALLYFPAMISTECDTFIERLNELRFDGNVDHKNQVAHLYETLCNVNHRQGLGATTARFCVEPHSAHARLYSGVLSASSIAR